MQNNNQKNDTKNQTKNRQTKNRVRYYGSFIVATGLIASLAVAIPAFAQTAQATTQTNVTSSGGSGTSGTTAAPANGFHGRMGGMGMTGGPMMSAGHVPGVFGTVSAISGTTLTVTSKTWQRPTTGSTSGSGTSGSSATPTAPATTPVTYTVDASSATVTKNNAASSVSSIAVGDTVMVQGTVSGTSVTATKINDGLVPQGMKMHGMTGGTQGGTGTPGTQGTAGQKPASPASIIQGNGEPVIAGSVSAISGTTLTVTNKSNVTYSVDASAATIEKSNASSTIASVAVGDNVIVQGAVSGTSVTASSVIDQGATPSATAGGANGGGKPAPARGFFGAIGNFFSRIFGF